MEISRPTLMKKNPIKSAMRNQFKSLLRAIDMLDLLEENAALSVAEISNLLGLPRSTTYKYLAVMRECRFLDYDQSLEKHKLGMKLFELGTAVQNRIAIDRIAHPYMEELSNQLGETVGLTVLDRNDALYVEKVEPESSSTMVILLRKGIRFPLHAGAASKILLAHQQDEKIETFLKGIVKVYGIDIGVITYKSNTQQNVLNEREEFCGLPASHFGNTSGLNEFENVKVGIIIGTLALSLDQKVELYNQFFPMENLDVAKFQPIIDAIKKGQYPSLKGTELEIIERVFDTLPSYDAIHRFRGLNEPKEIILMGNVPNKIIKEFSYKRIEDGQVEPWLRKAKYTPKSKRI